MIAPDHTTAKQLIDGLHESGGRLTLGEFLRGRGPDDPLLAELIEIDGRFRLSRGEPLELQAYLDAVPDLLERPVALDAAIDMTLRSLSGGASPTQDAIETLSANYPAIAEAIHDAAVLGRALWTTEQIAPATIRERTLPSDFGPLIGIDQRQYQLRSRLGDGASGDVFLAEDRKLSDRGHAAMVAIKILRLDQSDPWARRRAVEEAAKARRIDHPNVVRVLNRGATEDGEEYLVYEFVPGGDMASPLFSGQLPLHPRRAARLVADIARGVQAAHSAGLVHCDIKPGNILLAADGAPKVADFGAAIRPLDDVDKETGSRPVGTLAFMAPEQFRMEPGALGPPADVYALGGVLYWLLTGRLAAGATRDEVVATHTATPPRPAPSPRSVCPAVETDLDAICRRALSPTPSERFASPGEFADDLEAWLRREPIAWTRPSAIRIGQLWACRRPALAASMLALLIVSVTAGIWLQALSNRANDRERAAAMADLRARSTQSDRVALNDMVRRRTVGAGEAAMQQRVSDTLWSYLWLENLLAPMRIENPDLAALVGLARSDYAQRQWASARQAAGGDSLEALMWGILATYWLTADQRMDEALDAASILEPSLRARFGDAEPTVALVAAIRAVAEADTYLEAPAPVRTRTAALRLAQRLESSSAAIERSADEWAIQRLIDQRLVQLYGPCALGWPAQEAAARARLAAVGAPEI